jgi:hypothetical protein
VGDDSFIYTMDRAPGDSGQGLHQLKKYMEFFTCSRSKAPAEGAGS